MKEWRRKEFGDVRKIYGNIINKISLTKDIETKEDIPGPGGISAQTGSSPCFQGQLLVAIGSVRFELKIAFLDLASGLATIRVFQK